MDINNYNNLKKFKNISDFFSYQKDAFYDKIKNPDSKEIDNINHNKEDIINYKSYSEPTNIYTDYIELPRYYATPISPEIIKYNVKTDDIFITGTYNKEKTERLKRLYSASGMVYRFNRGITIIGRDGTKVEDVFDGTAKHHATSLVSICKDYFGIEIPFDGIASDMVSGVEAGNQGLVSMLYEGNNCMIFIPEDLTVPEIDEMIKEVEPRERFIFSVVRSMEKFRADVTQDELLGYLKGLKATKEKQAVKEKSKEKEKISINEYINLVLKFIDENNITLLEYYRNVGRQYRVREEDKLPEFERKNPFVDEVDIKLLVEKDDNKIVEYFARAMFRVINLNVSKDRKKESTEEGIYTGKSKIDKEPQKKPIVSPPEKLPIEEYINEVLNFIEEKNIDLLDYYRNVGRQYRVREEEKLPEFERKNPFVDEEDIKLLVEREDNKIVEYFARAMARVITSNLGGKLKKDQISSENNKPEKQKNDSSDIIEMLNDEQKIESEEVIEDISFDTLDDYNGYVVIRDDKNINIYTYDSTDNTKLKSRVTYPSEKFNLKSGYYINLKYFLNEIKTKYQEREVSFITESGVELDYNSIEKSLTEYCLEEGGIRLSNGKGEYLDDIFINRRDLKSFLSKFKVKYTIKKENNNQSVK